jgi:CBS domain-containing protein
MKVRDIMTKQVKYCEPGTNLAVATELMWNNDCGVLPVLDEGRLVGIVTDRDICMALGTRGRLAAEVTANEVAARNVQTCTPDADVDSAMAIMRRAKVRRLPVVLDSKLVGMLALNDIVEAVDRRHPDIDYEQLMDTVKAVCERRVPKRDEGYVPPTHWPPIPVAAA